MQLTQRDLNRTLLARQHLLERTSMPVAGMVAHLVGLQAQENLPPYLSLAARLESFDPYAVSRGLEELTYPFHDKTFTVTQCGRICFNGRKVNLSHVFAGQNVSVTQVGERVWLVTFMRYDLGYFDDETCRLEPIENPFSPKVLPMSSE